MPRIVEVPAIDDSDVNGFEKTSRCLMDLDDVALVFALGKPDECTVKMKGDSKAYIRVGMSYDKFKELLLAKQVNEAIFS